MPVFDYTVLDSEGQRRHGTIEAPALETAKEYLRGQGLTPLVVEPLREPIKVEDIFARFRGVPYVVLVYFFRQLATMMKAGIGIVPALLAMEEGEENVKFKGILTEVVGRVQAGESLYESFAHHPETFSTLHVAMVRAGESAGHLEDALQEIATQLEATQKIRQAIRSAMYYPVFVSMVAFVIISILLIFIVPIFANLFVTTVHRTEIPNPVTGKYPHSTQLPLPTRVVVDFSHIIYPTGSTSSFGYWIFSFSPFSIGALLRVILFAIFVFFGLRLAKRILREEDPRRRWDAFKLRLPMKLGALIQKLAIARFARTFASLYHAGVPVQEALEIVADTSGNVIVGEAVLKARQSVLAGGTIADPLVRSGVFPLIVTRMVEVGEETGSLEEMLIKVAEYFEDEVDLAIKSLTSIIEPLLIAMMGAVIGFIIVSTYLPMFDLCNLIGTGS